MEEEEHFKIGGTIRQRLPQVSDRDGGEVRLHGRLFAQWLYYVFFRSAPFPTKLAPCPKFQAMEHIGVVEVPTKIREEIANNSTTKICEHEERSDWMSQCNEGVELFAGIPL